MSYFRERLNSLNPAPEGRRWLFVSYDQLSDQIGPLGQESPESLGIILIENPSKAARRPYHKQKLAYVLANLRAFALEQAERGVAVRHIVGEGTYGEILRANIQEPVRMMKSAEWEMRQEMQPLIQEGLVEVVPHDGWLTTPEQMPTGPPWRMDAFYRRVRQDTGLLMERGKPVGGKYSFDAENRKAWRGQPPAPQLLRHKVDPLKLEVGELIETHFGKHPGVLDLETLPAYLLEAEAQWKWALEECLPNFGPFEDAMSTASSGLFHTRVGALMNLQRLQARRLVNDVLARPELPLPCREGFVRQILGWREFVRHVHEQTEGFRTLSNHSVLNATAPLPPAYWDKPSGLNCLDKVVNDVWLEGYSHHITRLMVLSNIATLLAVSPRELTDWFWLAYIDAYDWVVEPNVMAMGTYGVGDVMTTKPYISGAAYIDKMSDFCKGCRFTPKIDCPITPLYWAFLERNREVLAGNYRMSVVIHACANRDAEKKAHDAFVFQRVSEVLQRGDELKPEDLEK